MAAPLLIDEFGLCHVLDILVLAHLEAGREKGGSQCFAYLTSYVAVGDTYAYLSAVLEYLWQSVAGWEDKGKGAGQVIAHEAEGVVVYLHIFAHAADVVCNDGEQVMLGVHPLDVTYALYGSLLQRMTPEGVGRVCGVDDDSAIVQYLDDAVNVAA